MCGIVGGTRRNWPYDEAIELLRHRGPDSQQIVRLARMTLGLSRLAIIDPREIANQPMCSSDGNVWIVFNGEIYGFERLRRQLETEGLQFRTKSDTEVLLNAYLHWGEAFPDRLDGMFAAAIYDRRDEKLRLYRDRCGIKPLYYFWDGREFAFASEINALEALCGGVTLDHDPTSVWDFLTYRYVPSPKTLYKRVFKLEPATWLLFDIAAMRLRSTCRYWRLEDGLAETFNGSEGEAAEELRYLVKQSVRDQLVADVPVGFFLSGGLDSSVVVATASAAAAHLNTFSIGFQPPGADETRFAERIARRFGTNHTERIYPREALSGDLASLRRWYGEPFADLSAFPTYCVSQTARHSVTVALSGDGGDELFGGYRSYVLFERLRRLACGRMKGVVSLLDRKKTTFAPRTFLRRALNFLVIVGDDELSLYTRLMGGMTRTEKADYRPLLEVPEDYDDYWHFRRYWRKDLQLRTRLQFLDFHTYLPDDLLTKVDRASMACSLEVRVPLLDRRLVEFCFSLPETIRYLGGDLKGLVRSAYRDILPVEILERDKRGFSLPTHYLEHDGRRLQEVVLAEQFSDVLRSPSRSREVE